MNQSLTRNRALKGICHVATVAIAILVSAAIGWAQGDVQTDFKPTTEADRLQLDARSDPAQATADDDAALAGKGYVKIGTVKA